MNILTIEIFQLKLNFMNVLDSDLNVVKTFSFGRLFEKQLIKIPTKLL